MLAWTPPAEGLEGTTMKSMIDSDHNLFTFHPHPPEEVEHVKEVGVKGWQT